MSAVGTMIVLIYAVTFLWQVCFPTKSAPRG